jgi:hypothetical protein
MASASSPPLKRARTGSSAVSPTPSIQQDNSLADEQSGPVILDVDPRFVFVAGLPPPTTADSGASPAPFAAGDGDDRGDHGNDGTRGGSVEERAQAQIAILDAQSAAVDAEIEAARKAGTRKTGRGGLTVAAKRKVAALSDKRKAIAEQMRITTVAASGTARVVYWRPKGPCFRGTLRGAVLAPRWTRYVPRLKKEIDSGPRLLVLVAFDVGGAAWVPFDYCEEIVSGTRCFLDPYERAWENGREFWEREVLHPDVWASADRRGQLAVTLTCIAHCWNPCFYTGYAVVSCRPASCGAADGDDDDAAVTADPQDRHVAGHHEDAHQLPACCEPRGPKTVPSTAGGDGDDDAQTLFPPASPPPAVFRTLAANGGTSVSQVAGRFWLLLAHAFGGNSDSADAVERTWVGHTQASKGGGDIAPRDDAATERAAVGVACVLLQRLLELEPGEAFGELDTLPQLDGDGIRAEHPRSRTTASGRFTNQDSDGSFSPISIVGTLALELVQLALMSCQYVHGAVSPQDVGNLLWPSSETSSSDAAAVGGVSAVSSVDSLWDLVSRASKLFAQWQATGAQVNWVEIVGALQLDDETARPRLLDQLRPLGPREAKLKELYRIGIEHELAHAIYSALTPQRRVLAQSPAAQIHVAWLWYALHREVPFCGGERRPSAEETIHGIAAPDASVRLVTDRFPPKYSAVPFSREQFTEHWSGIRTVFAIDKQDIVSYR